MNAEEAKRYFAIFILIVFAVFVAMVLIFVLIPETKAGELGSELRVDINIIHDGYAETQAYKAFFVVFSEELLRFMKENRDKISGQHRVFVLEFYRVMDPDDKMIFIYLDLNKSLKEPLLVHRERVSKLIDVRSVRIFAGKTVENLIRIIGEKGPKNDEM
ncbi:MAG: hypothetical protein Q7S78_02745 [Candidatus Azambacteria bacterium]|nr:hypothetical protein [Candidatus Azambacteria bacterium]